MNSNNVSFFRSIDHLTACNDNTKDIVRTCDTEKNTCPEHADCDNTDVAPYHVCTCQNGYAYFPKDSEIASIEDPDIPDDDKATITPHDDAPIHPEVISKGSFEWVSPVFSETSILNYDFDSHVKKLEPSLLKWILLMLQQLVENVAKLMLQIIKTP